MYSALPNDHIEGSPESKLSEEELEIIRAFQAQLDAQNRMKRFIERHGAADFAHIGVDLDNKTQYKKRPGQGARRTKGGGNSKESMLLDDWVDLQAAIENELWEDAYPLYFRIRRLLNG